MRIAIGSIFRSSSAYIDRYAAQVDALKAVAQHEFRMVLVDGDSSDDTHSRLKALYGDAVTKREHGGPVFASVDDALRWKQISFACDGVLQRIEAQDDVLLWVESDLIWKPSCMVKLLGHLEKPGVDVVAPMCWGPIMNCHETWGHRGIDGVRFGPNFPYHSMLLEKSVTGLYPMNAAGSCLVMRGEVARTCRFDPPGVEGIVGFCGNIRKNGWKLWLDPRASVHHP